MNSSRTVWKLVLAAALWWGCAQPYPSSAQGTEGTPGPQGPEGPAGQQGTRGPQGERGESGLLSFEPSSTGVYPLNAKPSDTWTLLSRQPVFSGGPPGAWDGAGALAFAVLKVGDTYRMYYTGYDTPASVRGIGVALSSDGLTWTRASPDAPLLEPGGGGSWDSGWLEGHSLIRAGSTWYLFYSGGPAPDGYAPKLGLATSSDGLTFTRSPTNPVLTPTTGWESHVKGGSVLFEGGTFTLWYGGCEAVDPCTTWRIGRATSTDGVSWTRDPSNPLLVPQAAWEGQSLITPQAVRFGQLYTLLYLGQEGPRQNLGMATSWDGRTWTKHRRNPVLSPEPGTFFSGGMHSGPMLADGDRLWLWFSGWDGTRTSVGAAAQLLP